MKFSLHRGLPFIKVEICHCGQSCAVVRTLIDTGSASSIFCSDLLSEINVLPKQSDKLHCMQGIGGYEYVVEKVIDSIICDKVKLINHAIQLGELDYGYGIQGIIGSDILNQMNAVIDYKNKTITFSVE